MACADAKEKEVTNYAITVFWLSLAIGAAAFLRAMLWATKPRNDMLSEYYRQLEEE